MDDKAKKAIRENLALTAKAIYHYEMMLLIPDDERLTYLTDNLQVSFKSGQKVGHLIEYDNRCSQYNNYIKEMSLCLDNKTHHGEALKMSNDQIGDAIVEERPHSPAVLQKGGDGIDGR